MSVKVRLIDSVAANERGETKTVELGQEVFNQARKAVTGQGERPAGNISHDDGVSILNAAATTGFQHRGQLSPDEETFLAFLRGPGSDRRSHSQIRNCDTGEQFQVQTTDGIRSGQTALTPGSTTWVKTAAPPLLKGVEDRAYAEFGGSPEFNPYGIKMTVQPYFVTIDSPKTLEQQINETLAAEAAALPYQQPVVYEPARVMHTATTDFTGQVVTSPKAHLNRYPLKIRDGESAFTGSETEAALAKVISQLGNDDWRVTNYVISDGNETFEVGAMIYSAELGVMVRFGWWERS